MGLQARYRPGVVVRDLYGPAWRTYRRDDYANSQPEGSYSTLDLAIAGIERAAENARTS